MTTTFADLGVNARLLTALAKNSIDTPVTVQVDAIPPLDQDLPERRLRAIPGNVPALGEFPEGCPFRNRCPRADWRCQVMPELTGEQHKVACWHPVA